MRSSLLRWPNKGCAHETCSIPLTEYYTNLPSTLNPERAGDSGGPQTTRDIPRTETRPFRVFRNYTLLRQLVAFQKRFRLLVLPIAEIRPEFDASNAGMLHSGMPRLAKCQKSRRVSTRRHRVVS